MSGVTLLQLYGCLVHKKDDIGFYQVGDFPHNGFGHTDNEGLLFKGQL